MAVYIVTWDLNQEANYPAKRTTFIAHLERYENIRDAGLDSVRFIWTSSSAEQVSKDLQAKLDNNDRIIVTQLAQGGYYGRLTKDVWDWISARL
jgi:hypothetical protein